MAILRYEQREFMGTFFALRIGLIACAVLVLSAPLAALFLDGELPPSISDSWWTDARTLFVVGLAGAASLLVVVRGDTLTEQTLLNVAGGLGFVVAAVACVPKDENGDAVAVYDPEVAQLNLVALWGLAVVGLLAWVVGVRVLEKMLGTTWHVSGLPRRLLIGSVPALLVAGTVGLVFAGDVLAERAHGPAAIVMFALLGGVALLRTAWGVRFLERIGDRPVDHSLTVKRLNGIDSATSKHFDAIYFAVAVAMFAVIVIAIVLVLAVDWAGWLMFVEVALLVQFIVFWGVQTREAFLDLKH